MTTAPQLPRHWQGPLGSIRVRILAAVLALLAGSSAVSVFLLHSALHARLDEEITVSLSREIVEFELLIGGLNPRTGTPFDGDLPAMFDVYFAREVPDEGESLLAYVGSGLYQSEDASDAIPSVYLDALTGDWLAMREPGSGTRTTPAGDVRYAALPLTGRGDDGLLMVVNYPAAERAEINGAVATQALIQFGTIVLASLIGLGLAGRVLRPLGSLADTAQTISGTDLTRRIPVRGSDEASRIASTFNDMLGRLDGAFSAQRRFLDDANHELRAPLTVIRGHVELLELLPDAEDRSQTIALIVGEIERMNRIVDELLLLARSDRPGFLSPDAVDLGDLTRDVHRNAMVLCDRPWILESCADAVVRVDGQRITQAMVQLAENACRHTPNGTPVRIGSAVEGGRARLWVHDSGPGIPPADAERIFGRFVKGAEHTGGSGLGLSIVAAIAEAHGGRARVVPGGSGACLEIVVPVVPAVAQEPVSAPAATRTAASSSPRANGLRR
ncbi:HAMP domain-containing sensor histidine kinase [Pseudonocardia sp.]|uniref:sensor histidine kinase n=1 Tax=Pseudonocardia sp. TaxID=60912 RepID=UPI00262EF41C|nr:HAMP domain-containing sensor histidine kinase [Pseudonocardia sp.]